MSEHDKFRERRKAPVGTKVGREAVGWGARATAHPALHQHRPVRGRLERPPRHRQVCFL